MTPVVDGKSLDGMSEKRICALIESPKDFSYQPNPARRVYIEKKNSTKMRPPPSLPCRKGYLRVTWNGDSCYCEGGILSRTPDELFEMQLSDYRGYEELRLTKGRREVSEDDEKQT